MQIVIDMDENLYTRLFDTGAEYIEDMHEACVAIRKGTPLPKGHGRLIDRDEVLKAMDTWDKFGYTETGCFVREPGNDYVPYVHYEDMVKAVSGMPTIIEADKAESEEADPMFIDELKQPIPNAIIIWLKTGEKIVFIDKE